MRANAPCKCRWRLQFTLRAMLLLTLVCALGLGWIAGERRKVWLEDLAVKEIVQQGYVYRDGDVRLFSACEDSSPIRWQKRLFGEHVGSPVRFASVWPGASPEVVEQFRFLRSVSGICLQGVCVHDEHLLTITSLDKVEWLNLSATDITDAGAKQLASLHSLLDLNLDHTEITDDSLQALNRLPLVNLSIRDTGVTDEVANRFLQEHPNLESFHHSRSPSAAHRKAFRELIQLGANIPDIPPGLEDPSPDAILVILDTDWNDMFRRWIGRPEDLARLADIDGKLCVALRVTACTEEYLRQLAQLDTTEELRLDTMHDPREGLPALAGMKGLNSLHIEFFTYEEGTFGKLRDGDLDFLTELPNLDDLVLSVGSSWFVSVRVDVSQKALLAMTKCPNLRRLGLRQIDIREETLAKIVECPNLETLEVLESPHLSDEVVQRYERELEKRVDSRK